VPLYAHEWATGVVAPDGHLRLETFELVDGLPRWRWRVGDVVVERELAMRHGHPSVAVVHRVVSAPGPVGLAVAAMCTWRDAAGSRHAGGAALKLEQVSGGVVVEDAYRVDGPGWQPGGEWHLDAHTRTEPATEDLWFAGAYFERTNPGGTMEISAWSGDLQTRPPAPAAVIEQARQRNRRLVAGAPSATLALAADSFIIRTPNGSAVVSGYPDGRAGGSLAGYEGLFLSTGRADEGRELLRTAAPGESPDAPFWLVHAVDRHVAHTGDTDLAAELAAPLARLLRRRLGGEGPLRVDTDELVRLDTTDRIGKPVELNALWVNALAALAGLLTVAGRDDTEVRTRHAAALASFRSRFPAAEGWLHDVVEGPAANYPLAADAHHDDPTLRPHQLFAWSLPHAPLAGDAAVLRAVGPALLTPLGLRTLAPNEYGYEPAGDEGAVQPWLIGPWADACRAAGLPLDGLLTGLEAHLSEWGLGSISETADGDPPHRATGRPFSARSVAEVLRVRGMI
jgi:hypothetical protein